MRLYTFSELHLHVYRHLPSICRWLSLNRQLLRVIYMYMIFKWASSNSTKPNIPELFLRHPLAAYCFCHCPQPHVWSSDPERDKGILSIPRRWWCPVGFLLDQFNCFQSFPGLHVIAIECIPKPLRTFPPAAWFLLAQAWESTVSSSVPPNFTIRFIS